MNRIKIVAIYIAALPWDLFVGWPLVLLIRWFWGRDLRWEHGVLSCEIKSGSWPLRPGTWPQGFYIYNRADALARRAPILSWGGTSVGHGVFYGPGMRAAPGATPASIQIHELHHVAQAETAALRAFFLAAIVFGVVASLGHWIAASCLGFGLWLLAGNGYASACNWLHAWLRTDPRGVYRGSLHEAEAYAVQRVYDTEARDETTGRQW